MANPVLRIFTYGADGVLLRDFTVDNPSEPLEFYAHQLLHEIGVVCVEVVDADETLRRCDAGAEFDQVVK